MHSTHTEAMQCNESKIDDYEKLVHVLGKMKPNSMVKIVSIEFNERLMTAPVAEVISNGICLKARSPTWKESYKALRYFENC